MKQNNENRKFEPPPPPPFSYPKISSYGKEKPRNFEIWLKLVYSFGLYRQLTHIRKTLFLAQGTSLHTKNKKPQDFLLQMKQNYIFPCN